MQMKPKVNVFQLILIVIILAAVLARRFYFKNFSDESMISFFAGVGIVLIGFLIYKLIIRLKSKK